MPRYDYYCDKCDKTYEIEHKMLDKKKHKCPTCRHIMKKVIGNPGIIFKGLGFHCNDYPKEKK